MRGLLVALLIATPALMLPGVQSDSSQFTVLIALLAAFLTFVEYNSNFPSIIEFREAPPFNRLRFAALFAMVFLLSAVASHHTNPNALTGGITSVGTILGNLLDFPYSPVRLAVLMMPPDAAPDMVAAMRVSAALSHLVFLLAVLLFLFCVRFLNWPTRHGAFNVWVNLPLFDPTAGRDVLYRLQRDARINITLGFLLPFVIPALYKVFSMIAAPVPLTNPQTLIWILSAWAFLPTSMIMRGIAMGKVASLISEKRRRAYADAEAEGGLQTA